MDDEKPVSAALLDEADIYIGMVEVLPSEATDRHLLEITECDLPIGVCKWNGSTFNYIKRPLKNAPPADTTKVTALIVNSLSKAGIELPAEALSWAAKYFREFDATANLDRGK